MLVMKKTDKQTKKKIDQFCTNELEASGALFVAWAFRSRERAEAEQTNSHAKKVLPSFRDCTKKIPHKDRFLKHLSSLFVIWSLKPFFLSTGPNLCIAPPSGSFYNFCSLILAVCGVKEVGLQLWLSEPCLCIYNIDIYLSIRRLCFCFNVQEKEKKKSCYDAMLKNVQLKKGEHISFLLSLLLACSFASTWPFF